MAYKYGSCLFDTQRQASIASVEDFLFAGGNNSVVDVAQMDAEDMEDEMLNEGWQIPFLSDWSGAVYLAQEVIHASRTAFVTNADAKELDEILERTAYTNGLAPIGGGARADAAIYNLARAEISKRIGVKK